MLKIKTVVVGISGGVDSAVAALLLKKKGYNVIGAFMQNWDIADEKGVCSADKDYKDASFVCNKLNIPLVHINFVKEYWNDVFLTLIKEYETGYTPNPDILCNKNLKFNYFSDYCFKRLGADAIATGHYAATSYGPYLEKYHPSKNVELLRAKDLRKDQTFFLSQIDQNSLRRVMFPLSNLIKTDVKKIAKDAGLNDIADKKESMGICFIGSRNFQDFIAEYIEDKEGDFVDIDTGKVVGKHNGIHQWTLGQRSRISGTAKGYFIAHKDVSKNVMYVASGTKHPAIYTKTIFTTKPHWISDTPKEILERTVYNCQFIFQHANDPIDCNIFSTDLGLIVHLSEHTRAITEGQYAVFYKDNQCLGGAKIIYRGVPNSYRYWVQNRYQIDVFDLVRKFSKKEIILNKIYEILNEQNAFNFQLDHRIKISQ